VQNNETPYDYYTWYQDGSYAKGADCETTVLLKTR